MAALGWVILIQKLMELSTELNFQSHNTLKFLSLRIVVRLMEIIKEFKVGHISIQFNKKCPKSVKQKCKFGEFLI